MNDVLFILFKKICTIQNILSDFALHCTELMFILITKVWATELLLWIIASWNEIFSKPCVFTHYFLVGIKCKASPSIWHIHPNGIFASSVKKK